MKRANLVKEARFLHVAAAALLLLSGVFLLVRPDLGNTVVRWLAGANFVIMGCVRLFGYFTNDLYRLAFQYDLAVGGFCVILGVLMLISPDNAQAALPYAIGIYVILDGLLRFQTAFDAKAFGMHNWVGLLVTSTVVAAGGVVVLIGIPIDWNSIMLVGGALVLDGAENIWNTMGTVRVRARKKNRYNDLLSR